VCLCMCVWWGACVRECMEGVLRVVHVSGC